MFRPIHVILCIVILVKTTNGANILFFIGGGSHSHRTSIEPLGHKLVEKGHNVSFFTPIKPTKKNPKFHEFCTAPLQKFYDEVISLYADNYFPERLKNKYENPAPNPRILGQIEEIICGLIFNSDEMKSWVESSQFDLVILDHGCAKCGYGLAYKFNAPTILSSALGPMAHEEDMYGLPVETSWLPSSSSTNVFTQERSLYDKLYITIYRLYSYCYTNWIALHKIDKLLRDTLDIPDMPPTSELEKSTSIVFFNQHFSNDYPRSLPPHVIQIGGMHCTDNPIEKIPKKVQDFIDGSGENGFILISFGTMVSMSKVSSDFTDPIMDVLKNTKTRFLWKWDGEPPKNLPSNVLAAEWFPQQELLVSKSIRAFITHGGQMSTHQGICHGVPMIVVPVVFDQPYIAQSVQYHQIGIHLELSEMKDKFKSSLNSILTDKMYEKNAKEMSVRFKDRPMSAVDTAYYWTEYVLRHRNVSYMRPMANLRQSWWQRRLLDVWGVLFIVILLVVTCIIGMLKFIVRRCLNRNVKVKKA